MCVGKSYTTKYKSYLILVRHWQSFFYGSPYILLCNALYCDKNQERARSVMIVYILIVVYIL